MIDEFPPADVTAHSRRVRLLPKSFGGRCIFPPSLCPDAQIGHCTSPRYWIEQWFFLIAAFDPTLSTPNSRRSARRTTQCVLETPRAHMLMDAGDCARRVQVCKRLPTVENLPGWIFRPARSGVPIPRRSRTPPPVDIASEQPARLPAMPARAPDVAANPYDRPPEPKPTANAPPTMRITGRSSLHTADCTRYEDSQVVFNEPIQDVFGNQE